MPVALAVIVVKQHVQHGMMVALDLSSPVLKIHRHFYFGDKGIGSGGAYMAT